jgi:xanthine dehydrogenase FAD-binding subunit
MIQKFFRPATWRDALALKAEWRGDARAVAGGSDLLVKIRAGHAAPRAIIDVHQIERLKRLERTKTHLVLCAGVTAAQCIRDPWIRDQYPALWRACQWLGGPQMQHMATLGGNLANASPAADTVPALMALGATVKLTSVKTSRIMPLEDFLVGPGRTVIAPDELIEEIRVPLKGFDPADPRPLLDPQDAFRLNAVPRHDASAPPPADYTTNMFHKAGARLAQVISIACMAGWVRVKGGKVADARLCYGSAAPTTRRGLNAEAALKGQVLSRDVIEAAVAALAKDIAPIDDVRGTAAYKRALCENHTRLFLQDAAGLPLTAAPRPNAPAEAPAP